MSEPRGEPMDNLDQEVADIIVVGIIYPHLYQSHMYVVFNLYDYYDIYFF